MEVLKMIIKNGFNVNLISFSAIDFYINSSLDNEKYVYLTTNADLIALSRIFDNIEYGYNLYDFAIKENDRIYLIKSNEYPDFPFIIQYFTYDMKNGVFKNIFESFNHIKRKQTFLKEGYENKLVALIECAKLISKYQLNLKIDFSNLEFLPINENIQKELLITILSGDHPEMGLYLLLRTGFVENYWHEIYEMINVDQIKDYHPEGNVWQHTMETFKYRKRKDMVLSLALLLHDIGKAFTHEFENKRFYKHAQIGATISKKFLKRLNFSEEIINKVCALVKYHMIPEAIERIPKNKLEVIKKEVDFKLLFELYRADVSSSYKKLNNYYRFKKFLKNNY